MAKRMSNGNPSHGTAVLDLPVMEQEDNGLEQEIHRLVEASRAGHLSERGKPEQFEGNNRKVIEGVNEMLDAILLPIGEGNRVLAQISAGNIDELITATYKGDHEKMKLAVNNVAIVLQALQKEQARLTEASREGRLTERGKANQFEGAYAGIVKGTNEMLDAILIPIGEGNRILTLVRGGKPPITQANTNTIPTIENIRYSVPFPREALDWPGGAQGPSLPCIGSTKTSLSVTRRKAVDGTHRGDEKLTKGQRGGYAGAHRTHWTPRW